MFDTMRKRESSFLFFSILTGVLLLPGLLFLAVFQLAGAEQAERPAPATAAPVAGATGVIVVIPTTVATSPGPIQPASSISFEITSGKTHVTLLPDQAGIVPLANHFIYVLVHFPTPISVSERQSIRVAVTPAVWFVEPKNVPRADTYAFGLRGNTPGTLQVKLNRKQGQPPLRFSIGILPVGDITIITAVNNRRTVHLQVGDTFLLYLGTFFDWTVRVADPGIISREAQVKLPRGAQGLYRARARGQTTLFATGDPGCRRARPQCELPSILMQIRFVVT